MERGISEIFLVDGFQEDKMPNFTKNCIRNFQKK